jgi:phage terminase large subunit
MTTSPPIPDDLRATAEEASRPGARPYRPYGSALAAMRARESECLLSGPAGTGKSRACLEKLHLAAQNYPGMRALIVRKSRESLTETALVTFETHVVEPDHVILATGGQRRMRQSYQYPNGSSIVVGGIDKPGKIMSTEYDLVYTQEAIELTENDWESLTTRLRNGKMPYQQIIADTNPDAPGHWLKRRCDSGRTRLIECRHEDNPVLFDQETGEMTPRGRDYLAKLDALTGPRRDRLRYGRWVQAEGVVYDGYDAAVHVVDRFTVPRTWKRFLVVDFGYTNPFVCQWWAEDGDGRLYRYREIYRTGRIVEDHARDILAALEDGRGDDGNWRETIEAIGGVVCDHDAEGRATLEKYLERGTTAAVKEVRDGIQAVARRLAKAGDGKPRIFFLRDSLVYRDPRLEEAKKPCCTDEEWDGYVWDMASKKHHGEEPIKLNDHGMDATRYGVVYADMGAGEWRFSGSDPADNAVARLPASVFAEGARDRRDERRQDLEAASPDYMRMGW